MKVIIIGAGEVGYHIAQKLSWENKEVVLIDKDLERLKQVAETLDVQIRQGSGASPVLLKEAGLEDAEMIVAVTDNDESNLVACLLSRILSPGITRIARIRNPEFLVLEELKKNEYLGLSLAINPEFELVKSIMRLLEVPGAVDVIDFADGLVRLIGVKIGRDSRLVGQTMIGLREIDPETRVLIAAIHRNNEVIIPQGNTTVEVGDLLYVVTNRPEVHNVLRFFEIKTKPAKSIIIVGGGQVGTLLARNLEKKGLKVRLIDRDPERCRVLSEELSKTVVLQGDGTDQALLEEENAADADYFIALTDKEEKNVLACLLARNLGAQQTITRINKFTYIPLVAAIGLEILVSSRLSAVSAILRNIRRGKVVSLAALKSEDAEVIEFEALETSSIVRRPLKEIKFPRQALIAAIVRRDKVIIPSGLTVIEPHDRIIIFTRREAISRVEKALTVKLEFF